MQPTPDDIRKYIAEHLICDVLEVSGDGQHFEALIVSPLFAGKSRIQRHQLVYGVLGDRMRAEIHALSMRTLTPEEHRAAPTGDKPRSGANG
jgi:acid stress-induced BolA-like protein IbaG/YrbA